MTHLQADPLILERGPVLFAALVARLRGDLETSGRADRLVVDLPADLPPIEVDAARVGQILENLVENAFKYGPPDGLVAISAGVDGDWLAVAVDDEGVGVPATERALVTEPFHRAWNVRESRIPGTGLGLASAAASWSPTVAGSDSKTGPMAGPELACRSRCPCCVVATRRCRPHGGAPDRWPRSRWTVADTILIVEDEPEFADLVELWMGRAGYRTMVARTGPDALRLFYEDHPDLLILDVSLPGLDGWQIIARVREFSRIPILMVTARSSEADKVRGLKLGADDYITKPLSFPELSARSRSGAPPRLDGQPRSTPPAAASRPRGRPQRPSRPPPRR